MRSAVSSALIAPAAMTEDQVEELTKAVLEGGLLVAGPQGWRLDGPLPPFAIPATLQDSLAARLDRLAPVKSSALARDSSSGFEGSKHHD
jgi:hypothetical protein